MWDLIVLVSYHCLLFTCLMIDAFPELLHLGLSVLNIVIGRGKSSVSFLLFMSQMHT